MFQIDSIVILHFNYNNPGDGVLKASLLPTAKMS